MDERGTVRKTDMGINGFKFTADAREIGIDGAGFDMSECPVDNEQRQCIGCEIKWELLLLAER